MEIIRKRADGLVQCGQTGCIEIQIKALEIARNIFHKLRRHLDPLLHDLIHELVRIVAFTLAVRRNQLVLMLLQSRFLNSLLIMRAKSSHGTFLIMMLS